mmetsp:Transcript_60465/g.159907  ORF Transcript_60465/g.159907 Transcript_60465/m.159907 type:complete len:370 (-) Transcript_60465:82-1191(-)
MHRGEAIAPEHVEYGAEHLARVVRPTDNLRERPFEAARPILGPKELDDLVELVARVLHERTQEHVLPLRSHRLALPHQHADDVPRDPGRRRARDEEREEAQVARREGRRRLRVVLQVALQEALAEPVAERARERVRRLGGVGRVGVADQEKQLVPAALVEHVQLLHHQRLHACIELRHDQREEHLHRQRPGASLEQRAVELVAFVLLQPHHRAQGGVAHDVQEAAHSRHVLAAEHVFDEGGDVVGVDELALHQVGEQRRVGAVGEPLRAATKEQQLLVGVQGVAIADALLERAEQPVHHLVPAGGELLAVLDAVAHLGQQLWRGGEQLEDARQVHADRPLHIGREVDETAEVVAMRREQQLLRRPLVLR